MKKLSEVEVSPTPWKQGYEYVSDDIVFDSQGNIVAEVRNADDARLCSAAPELYEALKDAIEGLPMCTGECEDCWLDVQKSPCKKKEIFAKARAALEKAGGKE